MMTTRLKFGFICAAMVAAAAQRASAQVPEELYDTGVEQTLTTGPGLEQFLGLSSGNIAGAPQRWFAQPFRITADQGQVDITEVDVHYFAPAGSEPLNIRYIIWSRNINTSRADPVPPPADPSQPMEAPIDGDQLFSGILGPHGVGVTDPEGGSAGGLHTYTGLCIRLNPGNYYLTIYGDGIGAGNNTGFSNAAWFIGGSEQPEEMERNAAWRSVSFPSPGFVTYTLAFPLTNLNGDPDDRYNACFRFRGYRTSTVIDCNSNGTQDYCEVGYRDCNSNLVADFCDVTNGTSTDCNTDGTPDECQPGSGDDCNTNGVFDNCENGFIDCNNNTDWDLCDTAYGNSLDCDSNMVPDECQPDCNTNSVADTCDIRDGAADCNADGVPDLCTIATMGDNNDCNTNGVLDSCESSLDLDCNTNGLPDFCDVEGTAGFFVQFENDGTVAILQSDVTLNTPVVAPSTIGITAGDFRLTANSKVNVIHIGGAYGAAGQGGDGSADSFRVRIYNAIRPGAAGSVVEAEFNLVAADIVRLGEATGQLFDYFLFLPNDITVTAGVHWLEVAYTSVTNTNDWFVVAEDRRSTAGGDTPHVILSIDDTPTYGYNWVFVQGGHMLIELFGISADANSNGVPDECETPQCSGCRGDLDVNGVLDGDDIGGMVDCALSGGSGCACADIDNDGDVDAADLAEFANREVLETPACP